LWSISRYGLVTVGGDLTLYLPGDPIAGYLAMPADNPPWPGVVVLHQAFGLDDDIRRISDRLAGLGYLAVAPDLLGEGGIRCVARVFADIQRGRGASVDQVLAVADWLATRSDCNGAVGAIGFCMGGGLAYLLGCSGTVRAVAPNYGQVPALDTMARSCPVVASYGKRDRVFSRQARKAERILTEFGIDHDVKLYPEAGHSFLNQAEGHELMATLTRPLLTVAYNREAAEDTWLRIESFFEKYLVVSS
jgi:carboxymethylenebutenolidase